jgi:hypothetical protein
MPDIVERIIDGHTIEVITEHGEERLEVDGRRIPHAMTVEGLYQVGYLEPFPSLLEAGEAMVRALPGGN